MDLIARVCVGCVLCTTQSSPLSPFPPPPPDFESQGRLKSDRVLARSAVVAPLCVDFVCPIAFLIAVV